MKELTAIHREGFKIRTLTESAKISETINALRQKGFQAFIIKKVANVNPESYQWEGWPCPSSAN